MSDEKKINEGSLEPAPAQDPEKRSAFSRPPEGAQAFQNAPKFDINGNPLPGEKDVKYEFDAGLSVESEKNVLGEMMLGFIGLMAGGLVGGLAAGAVHHFLFPIGNASAKALIILFAGIGYRIGSNDPEGFKRYYDRRNRK